MQSLVTFLFIFLALILLICFVYSVSLGTNQGLQNHEVDLKKRKRNSDFFSIFACLSAILITFFLPQNHKLLESSVLVAIGIILAIFLRKKLTNFLENNFEIHKAIIASFAFFICFAVFFMAESFGIAYDQKISLENRIALASSELLISFGFFGFLMQNFVFENGGLKLDKFKEIISNKIPRIFYFPIAKLFEITIKITQKIFGKFLLVYSPKTLIVISALLVASFYGLCCFKSTFLFISTLMFLAAFVFLIFKKEKIRNAYATKIIMAASVSYGIFSLGFVLKNPMIMTISACIGGLQSGFLVVELKKKEMPKISEFLKN